MKTLIKFLSGKVGMRLLMKLAKIGIFREFIAKVYLASINNKLKNVFDKNDTERLRKP